MKLFPAFLLFANAMLFTAAAQDINKCEADLKVFDEQMQAGIYTEAAELLKSLAKTCPKFSESIYRNGETVLLYMVESSRDETERKEHIEGLVALYKQYDKNFPANTNANEVKAAMLLNQYKLITEDELYKKLDEAFKIKRASFTDYNAIEAYFMLYIKKYEAGNKAITQEQFIEKISAVLGQVLTAQNNFEARKGALLVKQQTVTLTNEEKQQLAGFESDIAGLTGVSYNVNKLASVHLTCEKLEQHYSKDFETNKTNVAWLQGAVALMFEKKCYNALTLLRSAQALHELKPTAQSAFYLGTLAQRANKKDEAVAYFEKAALLESTPEKKTEHYNAIVTLVKPLDKGKAKEYLNKMIQLDGKSARPYLILAEMYSSPAKECGLNDFEQKSLYWLAIQTAQKAAVAEPRYKATAEAMIARYAKKTPNKEDVNVAKRKKGQKITYGCWINETITIPNL